VTTGSARVDRVVPLAAVAGIPALLAAAALLVVVAALVGSSPFWSAEAPSLAEAAYRGDRAATLAALGAGADPNARSTVSAGVLSSEAVEVDPLEAAIRNGDVEIVKLLVAHGAQVAGARGTRAACLARVRDAPQILDFLASRGLDPAPAECEGIDFTG
jgi:hypothetical protein